MLKQIPILEKRKIQAEVVRPLFKEMVEQVGRQEHQLYSKRPSVNPPLKKVNFSLKILIRSNPTWTTLLPYMIFGKQMGL